jgi:hypothetical protein
MEVSSGMLTVPLEPVVPEPISRRLNEPLEDGLAGQ